MAGQGTCCNRPGMVTLFLAWFSCCVSPGLLLAPERHFGSSPLSGNPSCPCLSGQDGRSSCSFFLMCVEKEQVASLGSLIVGQRVWEGLRWATDSEMKLEEKHLPLSQWAAGGPQPFLLQPQFGKRSCKVSSHRRIPITGANPGARARPGPHLAPGSAVPPAQGPVLLPGPCIPPAGAGTQQPSLPSVSLTDFVQHRWRMCPGPAHPQELQSQAPLRISTLTFHTLTDSNRLNENAQTPPLLYPLLSGHPWNPGKFQVLFTSLLS